MASALPPKKLAELKQIIHNQLVKANVSTQIKDALAGSLRQHLSPEKDHQEITEGEILEDLKRRGVVEEILQRLRYETPIVSAHTKPATHKNIEEELLQADLKNKVAVDPTRRYIFFHVLGGKAFIDHLNMPEYPGNVSDTTKPHAMFTLHILFRGQRFRSRPVPVACEPDLSEGFLLELHSNLVGGEARMADTETMLSLGDQIHLILTRTDPDGSLTLVGTHYLEWRKVLCDAQGSIKLSIELMGVGSEQGFGAAVNLNCSGSGALFYHTLAPAPAPEPHYYHCSGSGSEIIELAHLYQGWPTRGPNVARERFCVAREVISYYIIEKNCSDCELAMPTKNYNSGCDTWDIDD